MNILKNKEKIFILTFLLATVAVFFAFGLQHLTKFVTADEHYWMYVRVPQYWDGITKIDLLKTFINDKPGVSIALISSPALLYERHPENYMTKVDKDLDRYNAENMENLLLAFRLPILIFCGLFLFYIYWIIQKISTPWIALWATIFTGLSPLILGISQIINPDALLWTFSTAAIFSYIALLKYDQKKFLILTGIFTGMGMLSKYSIDILFPFYLFLMVFYFFSYPNSKEDIGKYFRKHLKYFSLIAAESFAIVAFFIPGIIIKPVYFYRMTLGVKDTWILWLLIVLTFAFLAIDTFYLKNKIIKLCQEKYSRYQKYFHLLPLVMVVLFAILIIGRGLFDNWQLFAKVPFDLKNISDVETTKYFSNVFEKILLEFNPLVFTLTPLVLILALYAWIYTAVKKVATNTFFILSITLFIFAYYISFLATDIQATARYSIIIYPLVAFLAAIGIDELLNKFKAKNIFVLNISASLVVLIFSASIPYLIRPFYFNYVNFLLPKSQTVTDAWGFGGYEAVQYLAKLPNAKELTIWSDYYGVCEFFPGKCIMDYQFNKQNYKIDYYVLTRRGRIKYTPFYNSRLGKYEAFSQAFRYYDRTDPVWEYYIGGRPQNYIRIFKSIE